MAGPPPTFHWKGELAGREVMFRSAEDPRDVQKFGSVQVGYVWLEEVCPGISARGTVSQGIPQEIFAALFGRIRQKGARRRMLLTSLPPPSQRHWFYRLFYEKSATVLDVESSSVEVTSLSALYELPRQENQGNLPPQYYESQLPLLSTQDQIERFLMGKVGSAYPGFAVYAGWNDMFHVKHDLSPYPGAIIRGWDGGLTPACVWLQLTQAGRCLVLAELCGKDVGIEEFGRLVQQYGQVLFGPRTYQDFCDPSMLSRSQNNAKSCRDYLQPLGINLRPAPQDPIVRIHAVRGWLSRMGVDGACFAVHRRCEQLIEGFRGGYRFKALGGIATESPEKNEFSHVHDALQYPLAYFSRPPAPIYQGPKRIPDHLGLFPGQGKRQPEDRKHRIHFP